MTVADVSVDGTKPFPLSSKRRSPRSKPFRTTRNRPRRSGHGSVSARPWQHQEVQAGPLSPRRVTCTNRVRPRTSTARRRDRRSGTGRAARSDPRQGRSKRPRLGMYRGAPRDAIGGRPLRSRRAGEERRGRLSSGVFTGRVVERPRERVRDFDQAGGCGRVARERGKKDFSRLAGGDNRVRRRLAHRAASRCAANGELQSHPVDIRGDLFWRLEGVEQFAKRRGVGSLGVRCVAQRRGFRATTS